MSDSATIQVIIDRAMFERIEQLRREQPVIPPRAELLRNLIERGLEPRAKQREGAE